MALTKDKKQSVVAETEALLNSSKMTVLVRYPGTSVKALQELRTDANQNGTTLRVIKNRLFKKALESQDNLKNVDTSEILTGQLLYAFNDRDEVAPAQSLANFAKTNPHIEFVAGLSADGQLLSADDVQQLAALPTKEQLRGQLVGTIAAPLTGFAGVVAANVRSVLYVLKAREQAIN